ncbi:MAG: DUF5020 family protein, partial [Bacteroidales bacterium]|nr:DUF5020 family protein [Bacteroidales bacterium]
MKKTLSFFVLMIFMGLGFAAKAQNIQVMYDFGGERKYVTTTLEMYKPDKWGNTFFFVDIYHNGKNHPANYGPMGMYMEIERGLNFWQNTKLKDLSAHVEYTGGLGVIPFIPSDLGYNINNAWMFGAEYCFHSEDYRNTLTVYAMYKTIAKVEQSVPLQFSIVWGMQDLFNVKGLRFNGFADFWWQENAWVGENLIPFTTGYVFISEPQLWYNVGQFFNCDNLNIGGEVEFSYNFGGLSQGQK